MGDRLWAGKPSRYISKYEEGIATTADGEISADGYNHRVEKISQHFIDSSFNE